MATGKVTFINKTRGMFVVLLNDGSYSVIETSDIDEIGISSNIKGNLDEEGYSEVLNTDTSTTFDVIIQNAGCSQNHAMRRAELQ
jgi:hypothetical protein